MQVGGHAATVRDHEIPARHGVRQTIGDTLGIGGIIRTLRTAPVMLGIGNDMAERLPGRVAAELHEPDGDDLPARLPGHAAAEGRRALPLGAGHHGADRRPRAACRSTEVTYFGAGINHQTFLYRLEHGGESLYPRLDAAIERNPDLLRRVRVDMYRRLGYFPTESSEHSAEYSPWYMRHDSEIERLRIPVADYVGRGEEGLDEYAASEGAELAAGTPLAVERSWEYASLIINSIETGEPSVIYGNVRNTGPDHEPARRHLRRGAVPGRPHRASTRRTSATSRRSAPRSTARSRTSAISPSAPCSRAGATTSGTRRCSTRTPRRRCTLDQIDALVDDMLDAYRDLLPESLR